MQIYRHKQIRLKANFLFWSAVCVLVIPINWFLSWLLAVSLHELSHYLTLRLFKVQIYSITIGLSGAEIETEPMPVYKEIISALSGPLGGFCALLFARNIPLAAICAFLQSLYNLIPIYPLDGGRVLRCCLISILGNELGCRLHNRLEVGIVGIIFVLSVIISYIIKFPALIAVALILLLKNKHLKIPCKEVKQIVQ